MKYQTMTALFALTFAVTMPVLADDDHDHDGGGVHAGDIELEVDSHDGETHIHVHGGPVFASELGLTSGSDTFAVTDAPGFDSEADTFPADSRVGFDLLAPLKQWDGTTFVTEPTYKMQLEFDDGIAEHSAQTGSGLVSGFDLPLTDGNGFHRHYNFSLRDGLDNVPTLPDGEGVYLLEMSMWSDNPSIEASDPFWIVFNFGETESTHGAAVEYVETTVVPEPTAVALLGVGALALAGRRRRAGA